MKQMKQGKDSPQWEFLYAFLDYTERFSILCGSYKIEPQQFVQSDYLHFLFYFLNKVLTKIDQ